MNLIKKLIKKIIAKLGFSITRTRNDDGPSAALAPVADDSYSAIPGTIIAGERSNIKIGRNVSIGGNVLLYATAPITIGDDTMIALNAIFHASTHNHNQHPMWATRIDRPISVGKHVWIGTCAIILPGVIIEDYAVVGAGSVVTANVPEGAIVAGNPARIIGYRDKRIYHGEPLILDRKDSVTIKGEHCKTYCKSKL